MHRLFTLGLAMILVGCLADKGPESELPEDAGKDDSQRKPTDHGIIAFGTPAISALTADARYHAWTFELSAEARVDLTTSYAVLGQRRTDTVLYLYKEGATGWGSYIARNDDYANTTYSQLKRDLGAGRYRALVKGHQETTYGKFKLTAMCVGAGCFNTSCVFGQTYGEIADNPALQIINRTVITPANLPMLNDQERQWLVDAVKQSSHTDKGSRRSDAAAGADRHADRRSGAARRADEREQRRAQRALAHAGRQADLQADHDRGGSRRDVDGMAQRDHVVSRRISHASLGDDSFVARDQQSREAGL